MSSPTTPEDLLDLKLLPAWVNEPPRFDKYANFDGEDHSRDRGGPRSFRRDGGRDQRGPSGDRRPAKSRDSRDSRPMSPRDRKRTRPDRDPRARLSDERSGKRQDRPEPKIHPPIPVNIRFLPHPPPLNSVIEQIKSGLVAYSVFALARLFLERPERYDVKLSVAEDHSLFQLGDHGAVALDRGILENVAFSSARDDFYAVEVSQTEPLKGNFSNVARCRLSGTLLGPTNHHNYQPQLRSLYESRFSGRMSFVDYQKQVDIVSDPAVVEEWKEQARSVTTYTTKAEETAVTFTNAADVERHFRKSHLPNLIRSTCELALGGVLSRGLPDRILGRAIEEAWVNETRSPSKMMQELVGGLRQAGLNIFRHRRGMLFVSPIRSRAFSHESAGVSPSINRILEKVRELPGINLKQLAEQLTPAAGDAAEHERAKLSLASDLHWLVSEGYVIEFNDGSLDLPKAKAAVVANAGEKAATTVEPAVIEPVAAEPSMMEPTVAELQAADGIDEPQPIEANEPGIIAAAVEPETSRPEESNAAVTTADPAGI